jgi:hypothetical protein
MAPEGLSFCRFTGERKYAKATRQRFARQTKGRNPKMKKLFQKTVLVLTMALMGACDEKMLGESDASTPASESCVLYAAPGAEADAGTGESETSPLSSVDAVVSKASALKSRCGDATEVRFADGSLSNEQLGIATEALKSAGIKVGKYSTNNTAGTPSLTSDQAHDAQKLTIPSNVNLETSLDLTDKLPGIDGSLGSQDFVSRQGTSPWWQEYSSDNIFYDTGNVAIGANEGAVSKLQIHGTESGKSADTMPVGTVRIESTNAQYMFLDGNEIDSYANTSPWGVTTLHLNYNSKSNLTMVRNGGIVGIGADPVSNMEMTVKGLALNSTASQGTLQVTDPDGAKMVMDSNEINGNGGLYLNHRSNQFVMMCGAGCNVGVGYFNVDTLKGYSQKLVVDGGIRAEELVLDNVAGADFVFEDEYDLMSLEEVSSFVEENRHLPGIAAADEMKTNGLAMGEFQIQLLQKVEELTLYAIEQNERIKKMEQENRSLWQLVEAK